MAVIKEELYLADKFSDTFKNFDAAANASIDATREFQRSLNDFAQGYIDGLTEELNNSRRELESMIGGTKDAASAQSNLAREASNTGRQVESATDEQEEYTEEVRRSASASGNLLSTVRNIAAAVGAVKLAKEFISTADEMSQITAKLNLINDGFQTTADLQTRIYESAQRTRSSYTDTAQLISRIGLNTGDTFRTNAEMITFAENLNKSFKVAGATAQEQSSVILQLSQALASGVLRGQEFNAVMSGAPNIIRTIANYMGVTVGEMRNLAAEGQITADIIREAMLNSSDEINAQFETLPQTFGDIMTTAKNQITTSLNGAFDEWIQTMNSADMKGVVDDITDAVSTLAEVGSNALLDMSKGVIWLRENWESIEPVLVGAGAAILAYKAVHITAAGEVQAAWAKVNTTLNGIALGIGAIATAGAVLENTINNSESVKAAQESGFLDSVGEYKGASKVALWFSDIIPGFEDWGRENAMSAFEGVVPNEQPTGMTAEERAQEYNDRAAWYTDYYGSRYTPNDEAFNASLDVLRLEKMWWQENQVNRDETENRVKQIADEGVSIKNEVKLADEDIRILRDIAEFRYTANVALETLAPNVTVNVGEGGANLSAEDIAEAVATVIAGQISERTAIAH